MYEFVYFVMVKFDQTLIIIKDLKKSLRMVRR